jgi:hypothetical protein
MANQVLHDFSEKMYWDIQCLAKVAQANFPYAIPGNV